MVQGGRCRCAGCSAGGAPLGRGGDQSKGRIVITAGHLKVTTRSEESQLGGGERLGGGGDGMVFVIMANQRRL